MTAPLAPLAVAVPLLAGALVAALGRRVPRLVLICISIGAAVFATIACAVLSHDAAVHGMQVHWFGGWTPRHGMVLGIAFVVDPASGALAAFAAFLTVAALAYAGTYYEKDDGSFSALMLMFSGALIGFFLTGDLFNAFVFFELMSVSAYALTGFRGEDPAAVQGAFSFAVINSTGALLVLVGIAILYARTGALAMAQIAHALGGQADGLVIVAFALIVIGFLVKAAIVPFHFWLSDAHAVAPTPLCALFSGIMVQAGLYAVARCYWSIFSGPLGAHAAGLRDVLLAFGLATAIAGAIMCFAQRHLKRLLAFSTVAHSGIMLCAIALFDTTALGGFFVYVLGHGLIKAALFLGSGIILNRYRTLDVETLRARLSDVPWLAVLLGLGALGIAGMPPFGTFLGKALIDEAAGRAGLDWVNIVLLVAAALTGGSLLNALGRMTFGWGPPPDPRALTPGEELPETQPARGVALAVMATPAVVLLALASVAGFAVAIGPTAVAAAQQFCDRALQERVVLGMTPGLALAHVQPIRLASGMASGFASAALAVAFAAAGLFAHCLPSLWRYIARMYDAVMRLPHAIHSGIVTDYLTWLIVGSATVGAALLVTLR